MPLRQGPLKQDRDYVGLIQVHSGLQWDPILVSYQASAY